MTNGSVQHLICSECGGERVRTASGMVCPNGHGRIFPPMTNSQIRKVRQAIEIEKLPKAMHVAIEKRTRFTVEGMDGTWLKANRTATDKIKAKYFGKAIWLRPERKSKKCSPAGTKRKQ